MSRTQLFEREGPSAAGHVRDLISEQIRLLSDAGVDFLILETFFHLEEMLIAIKCAGESGLPIMATMTFRPKLTECTDGHSPADCARAMVDAGASSVGANCEQEPERMLSIIREMREAVSVPIAAQPATFRTTDAMPCFTKLPQFPDEMEAIQLPRSAFETFAKQAKAEGIQFLGGCCGCNPAYIRALADGLFREPPLDPVRRESLRAWTARLPAAQVAHWAARLDRGFTGGGRQRGARAIEVALLTGRALSWWQREARETGALRPWYIHLTLPRDVLQRRIAARVDQMLAAGLVAEVRGLLEGGLAPDAPGLDGVGYREVIAMLRGTLPAAGLRDAILIATRRYAKRQETWFRHQLRGEEEGRGKREEEVWTLDATESPDALAARIMERWRSVTLPSSHFPLPR